MRNNYHLLCFIICSIPSLIRLYMLRDKAGIGIQREYVR